MAEYLTYPFKTMGISQDHNGSYSHAKYSEGKPADYPVDETGADRGSDWMYAPVDLKVMKIYGRGIPEKPNTVWLQTTKKVITPIGFHFVCGRITHMSDADLKGLKVGHVFRAKSKMFREGTDGNVTGRHLHMTWGTGKFKDSGWRKNNRGAFVLTTTGSNRKLEKLFFMDPNFTTRIRMSQGLKFKKKPTVRTMYVKKRRVKTKVRASYSVSSKVVGRLKSGTKVKVYVTYGNWCCVGDGRWIHKKYLKNIRES